MKQRIWFVCDSRTNVGSRKSMSAIEFLVWSLSLNCSKYQSCICLHAHRHRSPGSVKKTKYAAVHFGSELMSSTPAQSYHLHHHDDLQVRVIGVDTVSPRPKSWFFSLFCSVLFCSLMYLWQTSTDQVARHNTSRWFSLMNNLCLASNA